MKLSRKELALIRRVARAHIGQPVAELKVGLRNSDPKTVSETPNMLGWHDGADLADVYPLDASLDIEPDAEGRSKLDVYVYNREELDTNVRVLIRDGIVQNILDSFNRSILP